MDRKNFKILSKTDNRGYSLLLTNKNRGDSCIFESNIIASLDELDTNKIKANYTKLVDCFACIGIFECLNNLKYMVIVTSADWITKLIETDIFKITGVQFLDMSGKQKEEDNDVLHVHKLLESGVFYFGKGVKGISVDISVNYQNLFSGKPSDQRFIWNNYLISPFINYGLSSEWYNGIVCGSFQANTIYSSSGYIKICVISRVSCQRVGTRFQTRGIDDSGNVANFTETEQCFINSDGSIITSYLQIRGSVPLFWEQPGLQVGSHKIKFSRNLEMSSIAYEKHFNALKTNYHRIMIINLLGSKEGERILSNRYKTCHRDSLQRTEIDLISFDYHREMSSSSHSNISRLKSQIKDFIDESHFCWIVNGEIVQKQFGVVRTNCVDCLDRTNAVQTMIGCDFLVEKQLEILIPNQSGSKLNSVLDNFRIMWKANGDQVSLNYAGSSALGVGNKLVDAQNSMKRTYLAHFNDSAKQNAMLRLLRPNQLSRKRYCRVRQLVPESVLLNMDTRVVRDLEHAPVGEQKQLRVFVGTWNVNGGKNFHSIAHKNQSVADWLMPNGSETDATVTDLFVVGFQEIVDLTAGNIVSSSRSANQQLWAAHLLETISRVADYVLLSTIQLVGICLFVFVRAPLTPYLIDLSTSSVKTGFKGTAGNKGAVAIRFQLYGTSFCFVCSHFAAGQSNVRERNEDFHDIVQKLQFSRDRTLECHDYVFWCGDFNYRIDMSNSDVKFLVANCDWAELEKADQLSVQRQKDLVFQGFCEGPRRFAPTYKYDLFCDDYDTSEKCRVPAWTDRVLWKTNGCPGSALTVRQLLYDRAELKTSDHRPVAALFEVTTVHINENFKDYILQLMLKYGPRNGIVRVQVNGFSFANDIPDDLLGLIINTFSEVGGIILVRFSGPDVLLNYDDSKSVLAAISTFDQSMLPGVSHKVTVRPFDQDWQDRVKDVFIDESIFTDPVLPPLMDELLKSSGNRQSVIDKEEFFNEDEDDLKVGVTGDGHSKTRPRSCSPPMAKESVRSEVLLKTFNLGEQATSCIDLVEKSFTETALPKRPPPVRPPPISKVPVPVPEPDQIVADSEPACLEDSEDLLGLYDESSAPQLNSNQNSYMSELSSLGSLHPPLVPVKVTTGRPLPPVPITMESDAEIMNKALSRPLPPIPPPIQLNSDRPEVVTRRDKDQE